MAAIIAPVTSEGQAWMNGKKHHGPTKYVRKLVFTNIFCHDGAAANGSLYRKEVFWNGT
ncbi:MAG: hypothetical protein AB7D06_05440 [Pedobacter sp.]